MRGKKNVWTPTTREMLETYLSKGYSLSRIAEYMNLHINVVRNEVRNGLTKEEYENRLYPCYTAKRSIEHQLEEFKKELMGENSEE